MKQKPWSRTKRSSSKSVLRLPDLEHSKAAVLNSLTCPDAQHGYAHLRSPYFGSFDLSRSTAKLQIWSFGAEVFRAGSPLFEGCLVENGQADKTNRANGAGTLNSACSSEQCIAR